MFCKKTWIIGVLILSALLAGCGKGSKTGSNIVTVWAHQGQETEVEAIKAIIASFNEAHKDVQADLKLIPSGGEHYYEDKVNSASMAGQLPDILDLDGPFVAQYAWSNILQPIDKWIDDNNEDFLEHINERQHSCSLLCWNPLVDMC